MNRIWRVLRVQLVNAPMMLAFPLGLLILVLGVNLAMIAAIGAATTIEEPNTGALAAIYIMLLTGHVQTMTQFFPFTLSLSVTRRTFYAATTLLLVGQALLYGVLLTLLRLVETATNGWGLRLRFFGLSFVVQDNPLLQTIVYAVPFLFCSFVGVFAGIVFKRWGQLGIYTATIGIGMALAVLAWLATWRSWWPAIGRFFTEQSSLALLAGYPLILAALFAGGGYLLLRRATV